MEAIHSGYKGLSLIWSLNWNLNLYDASILLALSFGAFIGSM